MLEASWITALHINKVRHLQDLHINLGSEMRHLILTGPNGVGKTSVLNALINHLVILAEDGGVRRRLRAVQDQHDIIPTYTDENLIPHLFGEHKFVIAYYDDFRKSKFIAPKSPEKPNLRFRIRENKVEEFLKFLVDMKVQQALARNENNFSDAEEIESWFMTFVNILRELFHDEQLSLRFNYHDYSFLIVIKDKEIPFTGLSAGYSAALDIVADLILKMQTDNRLVRVFDRPGIVLIDEIETHLHLSLQKEILPILTRIFPRIQFIVTTHSPFVLNSIKNAVVYDLVSKEAIEDLTDYSYTSLAEGYFGVETESGELKEKVDELARLIEDGGLQSKEKIERVFAEFEKIPNAIAPKIKTRLSDLRRKYYSRMSVV